ncbi:MAG: anthranilate phosphoribosyltransferase [Lentilitoribacter sp.]
MAELKPFIGKVAEGGLLSVDEAREAFNVIMSGDATPSQIGGFLMALRMRGETVDEISGAVAVMREKMLPVKAPSDAIDIVGTGGTGSGKYNISTCTAFVVAGCGVTIAKHGNKALSSKSGTADCFNALGLSLDLDVKGVETCIEDAGIGFMFAPNHHSAMRHVGPTRVELGTRTIFNLLGPLSNPANVSRQLLGVFSPQWVEPLAEVLKDRGSTSVWVVHGDGLDELTTTGPSQISALKDGEIKSFTLSPEDAGLQKVDISELLGGDGVHNAKALKDVLQGAKNAYREIVLLNSAASLIVAEKTDDIREGVEIAANSIDSGAAMDKLEQLISTSNRLVA